MKDIQKKFDKIEKQIAIGRKNGYSVKTLLKEKVRLLQLSYEKLSTSIEDGIMKPIAPIFAKELAFLNSIKEIQTEINETTDNTEKEIVKIHTQMREQGFGWVLDNSPEKKM